MSGAGFHFRAYGLTIGSDFEVLEAEAVVPSRPELTIRRADIPGSVFRFDDFRNYRITPDGDLIEFQDVGRFLVRNPTAIEVDVEPQFDRRLIGMPLLGPVFSVLLHRQGLLVLHGSAVMIGGTAHVFLGDKGSGKSTTAAALIASGFPLISDDVVAIERLSSGQLVVRPGYPAMKLDKHMFSSFPKGSYTVLQPDDGCYTAGKSRVRLKARMPRAAVPLGRIHCLARGTRNAIRPLSQPEKLHALIRFSHYPRLGPAANVPAQTARLFARAAALALHIDADILTVKHSLEEISQLGPFLACETENARAFT
ncbi:hypothetical protein U8326_11290 [Tsuneonella sp. CC-YZS046]|uniref:HPr kinase/phosphorylase n=1 Tax=Tsuneonella sp. CC-YZS046 TaxID=3042152 RepID=UPI002D76E0E4|nr:hypothetical protein [Tsuneonella sp. CC-YZS046]WRO65633.1 hypothetical protein U8326_11290 [Tsuneonella sp. CC-YZS046]